MFAPRLVRWAALPLGAVALAQTAVAQARFTGVGWFPPGAVGWSRALGVSADGSTVVGSCYARAFRWRESTGLVALDSSAHPGWVQYARGCSADGSVVVGYAVASEIDPPNPQQAMVWTANGGGIGLPDDWDPLAWDSIAFAVSGDGSIVVGGASQPCGALALAYGPGPARTGDGVGVGRCARRQHDC